MSHEVYEPAEDTQLLIDVVVREKLGGMLAADVGSGSGAVARAMHDRGARVFATDVNPDAVHDTRLLVPDAIRADLLSALRGPFDIVTFNAPYLPSSPEERIEGWIDRAFHGGEGGVAVSEAFVRDLPRVLAPHGRAYLVVSSRADLDRLRATVRAAGLVHEQAAAARFFFEEIAVWRLARA